ncbi:MAG: alkaline phosphatase [Clostridia bacterium]|nr:alkaline phosphatase [Clostridia bacterium]
MSILSPFIAVIVALSTMFTAVFSYAKPVEEEDYKIYDNVILMIGDGMGENHLSAAKDKLGIKLAMETVEVRGQSMTDNIWGETTDSAAGGTALATGIRTNNGHVGVSAFDPYANIIEPMNLCELAKSMGKSAGVVTTDATSGATPASFSAHAKDRDFAEEISNDQLTSDLDLIWGAKEDFVTKEAAEANGFAYLDDVADIEALPAGTRSFGQFSWDDFANVTNPDKTPTIEKMTKEAIDILDDNDEGFFLMVEGAHIDKFSHGQDIDNAVKQLAEFDKAIAYALDYAEKDGSTLVVITADHETGSVTYSSEKGGYYCVTGSHSDTNVPLLVSDADAGFNNNEAIKNKRVAAQLALCLGAEKGAFPACAPVLGKKD